MGKLIKFDHVNEHGDFEKILSHFGIDYQKSGTQLRCLCQLHDDTNPSLSIALEAIGDTKRNTWYCFGCKNSGSIIDFAAHVEGCDLRSAAELVAEVSGCSLAPARSGKSKSKSKKTAKGSEKAQAGKKGQNRGNPRSADKNAGKAPSRQPDDASDAETGNPPLRFALTLDQEHPYAIDRLGAQTVAAFGVGVCDPASRSMMAGRCCVPIHNLAGELIGYAGRYLGDDPNQPKWLMPPGFEKRRVLFNAHRVWGSLHVVLVEGFFDAIHLHTLGIPAVACIGTAVSEEQVSLLGELGVRRVTVLFDEDDEGQAAAERVVPALARAVFVRLGSLPVGCDPDEAERETLMEQARAVW
ncbi:toprim domain-containing protein [Roseovarius phycicola]|uniref:Toprim domain-containing protein n=1 Tax=Roseovarius phycicola TaxID=3080976 RepID=A0ABZ2HEJ0_9RHOB